MYSMKKWGSEGLPPEKFVEVMPYGMSENSLLQNRYYLLSLLIFMLRRIFPPSFIEMRRFTAEADKSNLMPIHWGREIVSPSHLTMATWKGLGRDGAVQISNRAVSVNNNNPPFSRMRIVLVGRKHSNGNTKVVQYAFTYFQGRYLIA